MDAVKFIQNEGFEEAKKALNNVVWCEKSYCTKLKHGCIKNDHECCVDVDDLKRLVESWELVKFVGGIESAKANINEMIADSGEGYVSVGAKLYDYDFSFGLLRKAIANVERVGIATV